MTMIDTGTVKIDTPGATVENRCACGCGTHLNPHGASMWFASQDCQSRFQQRDATNPDQVLARLDIHRIAALYDVPADLLSFSTLPP